MVPPGGAEKQFKHYEIGKLDHTGQCYEIQYMTRKFETCIYIQHESRCHRVSIIVTRLARSRRDPGAKATECLLGCHAARPRAVFGWHLKRHNNPHPNLLLVTYMY